MQIGKVFLVQILFALLIFVGNASTHPHELGQMKHGPSLEKYQIKIDFTNAGTARIQPSKSIQLADKNRSKNSAKKDASVTVKTTDKIKIKKEHKGLKIK